jgi:hypothetical protein
MQPSLDEQQVATSTLDTQNENVSPTPSAETAAAPIEPTSSGMSGSSPVIQIDGLPYHGSSPSSGSFVLAPSSQVLETMDAFLSSSQVEEPLSVSYPQAWFIMQALPVNATQFCGFEPASPILKYFLLHTSWVKLTVTYSSPTADTFLDNDNLTVPHEHFEITSDVPFSEWFHGYVAQAGFTTSVQANEACLNDPSQTIYFFDGIHTNTVGFTATSSDP